MKQRKKNHSQGISVTYPTTCPASIFNLCLSFSWNLSPPPLFLSAFFFPSLLSTLTSSLYQGWSGLDGGDSVCCQPFFFLEFDKKKQKNVLLFFLKSNILLIFFLFFLNETSMDTMTKTSLPLQSLFLFLLTLSSFVFYLFFSLSTLLPLFFHFFISVLFHSFVPRFFFLLFYSFFFSSFRPFIAPFILLLLFYFFSCSSLSFFCLNFPPFFSIFHW